MPKIKVIKSYQTLTETLKSPSDISYAEDKAMAEFRAFYAVAPTYCGAVYNPKVLEVMEEVVDNIKNDLQTRKSMLNLT